jgi:asparagine N-glycosylation enzyme membrane subunit Stt3
MAGAATAIIGSLIWYIAVLVSFYLFFGTDSQARVFRAEGEYEDFRRSGMADFSTFVMEDFFGAGFFHLLLGPVLAAMLASAGGLLGVGLRRFRKT